MRLAALVTLSVFLLPACASTDLRVRTAGHVPCDDPGQIEIVSTEYGGDAWVANCGGEQYKCKGSGWASRERWTSCVRVH